MAKKAKTNDGLNGLKGETKLKSMLLGTRQDLELVRDGLLALQQSATEETATRVGRLLHRLAARGVK